MSNEELETPCWIYKSLRKDEMYLYLGTEEGFDVVPEALMDRFGEYAFVIELDLSPERPLAREDVNKVISNIKDQGYHLQMPPILTPEMYHGNDM